MTEAMKKLVSDFGHQAYLYGSCTGADASVRFENYNSAKSALVEAIDRLEK